MILKRFYDDKLAQASFLVGCVRTREAAIIDPNREVGAYVEAAAVEGLRITAVTETHIHADFLSGSRELAERTGATLYLSDEGDADWKYGFADQPNVRLVKDGDSIRVGKVRLDVMKTPGHTPEHISFILTDEPACAEPLCAFTGDFIFVGDVGRPDLLETAAGIKGTMEKGARGLFESLQRFKAKLPNDLILWPSHGSGSACGKSLGGVPVSTLGYEKKANWAVKVLDETEFVGRVLDGQPEPPAYFKQMKRMNKEGPSVIDGPAQVHLLPSQLFSDVIGSGEFVADVRSVGEFHKGFIPGTIGIPNGKSFTNWIGWLAPYDRPIYLVATSQEEVDAAVRDMYMIGLDHVAGWFGPEVFGGRNLVTMGQISPVEMARRFAAGELDVLDVRGTGEFREGHVSGAIHIPLGYLESRLGELSFDRPIAIHCQTGYRSSIGASLLAKQGRFDVFDVVGGFEAYLCEGLPVEI